MLGVHLSGFASDVFKDIIRGQAHISFDDFHTRFAAKFDKGSLSSRMPQQQRMKAKIAPGESISGFTHRINEFAIESLPDDTEDNRRLRESYKLNAFMAGVDDSLYDRIVEKNPKSFDEAVDIALQVELFLAGRPRPSTVNVVDSALCSTVDQLTNGLLTITKKIDELETKLESRSNEDRRKTERNRSSFACFARGKPGHLAVQCRSRPPQHAGRRQDGRYLRQNDSRRDRRTHFRQTQQLETDRQRDFRPQRDPRRNEPSRVHNVTEEGQEKDYPCISQIFL